MPRAAAKLTFDERLAARLSHEPAQPSAVCTMDKWLVARGGATGEVQVAAKATPRGLHYVPRFLTTADADAITAQLQATTFTAIVPGGRRVAHFGYVYNYGTASKVRAQSFPPWLQALQEQVEAAVTEVFNGDDKQGAGGQDRGDTKV